VKGRNVEQIVTKGRHYREGRLSEEGKGGDTVDVFSTHV
jgi:hypothetical protein